MSWIAKLNGGPRKVNHATAVVEHNIYLVGGYCTGIDYRMFTPVDVYVLDTRTLRWRFIDYLKKEVKSFHSLEIMESHYGRDVPFLRYGHSLVSHGSRLYMWGGRNDKTSDGILYCFDTEAEEWSMIYCSGITPSPRDGHAACVVGDQMFIFGGYVAAQEEFSNDLYALNLNSLEWRDITTNEADSAARPTGRDFATLTHLAGKLYLYGGRSTAQQNWNLLELNLHVPDFYPTEIHWLDLTDHKWYSSAHLSSAHPETVAVTAAAAAAADATAAAAAATEPQKHYSPDGRRSHSAFVHGGRLYIGFGYNETKNLHFNDIFFWDPDRLNWFLLQADGPHEDQGRFVPCRRRRAAIHAIDNQLYLFGGTWPSRKRAAIRPRDEMSAPREKLDDLDDLWIFEFKATLKSRCTREILKQLSRHHPVQASGGGGGGGGHMEEALKSLKTAIPRNLYHQLLCFSHQNSIPTYGKPALRRPRFSLNMNLMQALFNQNGGMEGALPPFQMLGGQVIDADGDISLEELMDEWLSDNEEDDYEYDDQDDEAEEDEGEEEEDDEDDIQDEANNDGPDQHMMMLLDDEDEMAGEAAAEAADDEINHPDHGHHLHDDVDDFDEDDWIPDYPDQWADEDEEEEEDVMDHHWDQDDADWGEWSDLRPQAAADDDDDDEEEVEVGDDTSASSSSRDEDLIGVASQFFSIPENDHLDNQDDDQDDNDRKNVSESTSTNNNNAHQSHTMSNENEIISDGNKPSSSSPSSSLSISNSANLPSTSEQCLVRDRSTDSKTGRTIDRLMNR